MNEVRVSGRLRRAALHDAGRVACLGDEASRLAVLRTRTAGDLPLVFDSDLADSAHGEAVEVRGRLVSPLVVYDLPSRRQLFQACWVQVGTSRSISTATLPLNRVSLGGTVVGVREPWRRRGSSIVNAAVVAPDESAPSGQALLSVHVVLRSSEPPAWLRPGLRLEVCTARVVVSRYTVGGRRREACAVECTEDALTPVR